MLVAYDTETELVEPGCQAPRLVCLSYQIDRNAPQLLGRRAAPALIASYLIDPKAIIIGHNVSYDMGVLAAHDESNTAMLDAIFCAYRQGRVRDTMIREMLIAIRENRLEAARRTSLLSLGALGSKYLGLDLDKGEDSWRYQYGELMDTLTDHWPLAAQDYATCDASTTMGVYLAQGGDVVSPDEVLQVRAAWCLHLQR